MVVIGQFDYSIVKKRSFCWVWYLCDLDGWKRVDNTKVAKFVSLGLSAGHSVTGHPSTDTDTVHSLSVVIQPNLPNYTPCNSISINSSKDQM